MNLDFEPSKKIKISRWENVNGDFYNGCHSIKNIIIEGFIDEIITPNKKILLAIISSVNSLDLHPNQ
jgi:hypothetical protein